MLYLDATGDAVDPSRTRSVVLGNTTNEGGVWSVILPNGRILVAGSQRNGPFPSGPMAGRLLAIVDTSGAAPTITRLENPMLTGRAGIAGGFAIDPTGRFVYAPATVDINLPSRTVLLYRLDLATNVGVPIASWAGQVAQGIVCDDDGTVYVSATDPTPTVPLHFVHTVRPDGQSTSRQSSAALVPAGLDLDRASGRFAAASGVFSGYSGPQVNALSLIDPVTGATTVLASPPPGGWGVIAKQGVAVNNVIESYGKSSDSQGQHHWFENFPNPGGLPNLGHAGFSLTVRSWPSPPTASAIALSSGRGSTTVLGAETLVDLGRAIVVTVPTGLSTRYGLSVPSDPSLRGAVLTAQSVHVEPGGALSASRGLTLTVQ